MSSIYRQSIKDYVRGKCVSSQIDSIAIDYLVEELIKFLDTKIELGNRNFIIENNRRKDKRLPQIKRVCKYHFLEKRK